jgi:hypothetical protein
MTITPLPQVAGFDAPIRGGFWAPTDNLFGLTISDGRISRLQTIGRKSLQAGYEEIVAW